MKKIIVGLLVALLAVSLIGCGAQEKAGEAAAEKILKDSEVEADIDGEKVTIKGEDGQELRIGAGEWPSSDLAKTIPEFKGGKIVSVMEAEDSIFIMIEEMSEGDFKSYLNEIKKTFTEERYEMNTDTGMLYTARNSTGIGVMLSYEKDAGASITVTKAEPEEEYN